MQSIFVRGAAVLSRSQRSSCPADLGCYPEAESWVRFRLLRQRSACLDPATATQSVSQTIQRGSVHNPVTDSRRCEVSSTPAYLPPSREVHGKSYEDEHDQDQWEHHSGHPDEHPAGWRRGWNFFRCNAGARVEFLARVKISTLVRKLLGYVGLRTEIRSHHDLGYAKGVAGRYGLKRSDGSRLWKRNINSGTCSRACMGMHVG